MVAMEKSNVMEPRLPTLEEMQQWTQVLGRAQQLMLEQAAGSTGQALPFDPALVARIQTSFADDVRTPRRHMGLKAVAVA